MENQTEETTHKIYHEPIDGYRHVIGYINKKTLTVLEVSFTVHSLVLKCTKQTCQQHMKANACACSKVELPVDEKLIDMWVSLGLAEMVKPVIAA